MFDTTIFGKSQNHLAMGQWVLHLNSQMFRNVENNSFLYVILFEFALILRRISYTKDNINPLVIKMGQQFHYTITNDYQDNF